MTFLLKNRQINKKSCAHADFMINIYSKLKIMCIINFQK